MATGIMKPERKNRTRVLAAAAASVVLVAVAMAVVTHSSRSALISIVPAQALYEYHVPGDYLGGDGGVDSDYDDALAPSEYFAADEKGDAPFGGHGFGPEERSPVYQGEYHGYEGGEWVEMKARPQMLAMGNSIYQETGMAAPRPTKPIVHHPHHPGMHANAMTAEEYEANAKHHKHTYKTLSRQAGTRPFMPAGAMTAAQYEAKLGKDPKGHLLPKGPGGFKARRAQALYYQADGNKAREAYLAHHARAAAEEKAAGKKAPTKTAADKSIKRQSLYYQAAEQQARDAYLAERAQRSKHIQAEAVAKDAAAVKAFDSKVSKDWTTLNQMDAMAEASETQALYYQADGKKAREAYLAHHARAAAEEKAAGKKAPTKTAADTSVRKQSLHYVSDKDANAQVSGIFDNIKSSDHGVNNGNLRARAHHEPKAKPVDPSLIPAKGFFAGTNND